jgi:hypothetical protein
VNAAASGKAIARCKVTKTTINTKAHQGTKAASRHESKSKHQGNKRN